MKERKVEIVIAGESRAGRGQARQLWNRDQKSNFQLCSSKRSINDYEHPVSLHRLFCFIISIYIYIHIFIPIYIYHAVTEGNQSKAYKTSNDLLHFSHCVHKLSETNRRGRQRERERGGDRVETLQIDGQTLLTLNSRVCLGNCVISAQLEVIIV